MLSCRTVFGLGRVVSRNLDPCRPTHQLWHSDM